MNLLKITFINNSQTNLKAGQTRWEAIYQGPCETCKHRFQFMQHATKNLYHIKLTNNIYEQKLTKKL